MPASPSLERVDEVHVLDLSRDRNVINRSGSRPCRSGWRRWSGALRRADSSRPAPIRTGLSGKDPATYGAIKATLYRETIASLRDIDARAADPGRFQFAIELWKQAEA
jgi:hypothetical protein